MSALANHAFVKMNGLGNEIVVVDMRGQTGAIGAAEARAAAQPNGAPYDQLMTLHAPRTPGTDGYVRIYNNDGSEAGACGNGMRCIAELLFKETGKSALTLETTAGLLSCWKGDRPLVSTVDDVDAYDLGKIGPLLENHPIFPERANISLAQVLSREHLVLRTWERGAGLTKACGSAACAAAVAAVRLGLTGRTVTVTLPGGELRIEWRARDDHVLMTGPVAYEYEGKFDPALFEVSATQ